MKSSAEAVYAHVRRGFCNRSLINREPLTLAVNHNLTDRGLWEHLGAVKREKTGSLFPVVTIDFPWDKTGMKMGDKYSVLNAREFLEMPIELVQDAGYVFICISNFYLPYAFKFLDQHGYEYADQIIWAKLN